MHSGASQKGFALLLSLIISLAIIIILAVVVYFGYGKQKGTVEVGTDALKDAQSVQTQSQENAQQMQDTLNKIQ